jgi:protein-disulfide isomerase
MNKVFIPASIVVSGLIIAGAIYFTQNSQPTKSAGGDNLEIKVAPIDANDHIIGNPDAEIIIVEYSDFECPFCKSFHSTMNQIMEEYGPTGQVAWVYRHFPLSFHKRAIPAAEASECVAKLGGNEKFWEYTNLLYENTPESLSEENLLQSALAIGLIESEFKACIASDYPKQIVQKHIDDGMAIAQADKQFGTPYNILISKSGVQIPIRGAQPLSVVKGAINSILTGAQQAQGE